MKKKLTEGKKNNKITIVCIIVIVVSIAICYGVSYYFEKKLEISKNKLQQTIEKYGYVEPEKVNIIIAKFNTEIMDGGLYTPASHTSMVIDNNLYWYALTNNISCYVSPVTFSGNTEQDVADVIALYCDKEGYDESTTIEYTKKLLKANNTHLTEEKINELIEKAKEISDTEQMANNGNGISLRFVETDNHYEIQVKRIYK